MRSFKRAHFLAIITAALFVVTGKELGPIRGSIRIHIISYTVNDTLKVYHFDAK